MSNGTNWPTPDATRKDIGDFYESQGLQRNGKPWIKFERNANDLCVGWDGVSVRCQCGSNFVHYDEHGKATAY